VMNMKNLIVDYRISKIEENSLLKLGYNLLACPSSHKLYYAICGHPDIQIHIIDEKILLFIKICLISLLKI
ncbi:DUF6873 family GME fold protein, partial [Clostridium haemolyticum]|uniref:DUF6873 family GME fold protein n=1 Tax=Clostridium haemolyticum TaxID=84025 RepID=UPI0030B86799